MHVVSYVIGPPKWSQLRQSNHILYQNCINLVIMEDFCSENFLPWSLNKQCNYYLTLGLDLHYGNDHDNRKLIYFRTMDCINFCMVIDMTTYVSLWLSNNRCIIASNNRISIF